MVEKRVKKEQKKRKSIEELHAFEKTSVLDFKKKSICNRSSKEGEILKIGSGKLFNFNNENDVAKT